MSLMFGDQLTDIGDDEAALAEFVSVARDRANADFDGHDSPIPPYEGAFSADPDPNYQGPGLEDRIIPDSMGDAPKGRGPSAKIRRDVQAKTAMLMLGVGAVWEARDSVCGGVFVQSIPEVSEKLADIFCDSPDIIRWFTASGKYMKWLDLAMSLKETFVTVSRHHVTHSIDVQNPDGAQPDWSAYGANG